MKLFSVLDVKANHFQKIFCETSSIAALRGFDAAVNDKNPGNPLAAYPDDFALVELGDFDVNTGRISPHSNPLNLGSGRTVLRISDDARVAAESFRQ